MSAAQQEKRPQALEDADFSRRLYKAVVESGLNQSEVARKAGIVRTPSPQNLESLAKALGKTPEDLWSPIVNPPVRSVAAYRDPVGKALNQLQKHLSLDAYLKVAEIIKDDYANRR